ncbi:hypothetical protein J4032_03105 [Streptomyces formicae]|uniref:Uncharacterized protein n=1 Tax=Streptomyces formicae TaxID=1616117 RepID=A0ABY3WJB0_9ACTN|nr:hypothetical protein [Streptomyces formicae]UNM10626.1 hypothetical protein J4032_03105 [Streptomyces formicae]
MGDVLLALSIPLTVCASGIYALCDSWWRRVRRTSPSSHSSSHSSSQSPSRPSSPSPYAHAGARGQAHAAARLDEHAMLAEAQEIVDEAYERLAGLYGDVPVSAGSTADHDPSSRADVRTRTRPPGH